MVVHLNMKKRAVIEFGSFWVGSIKVLVVVGEKCGVVMVVVVQHCDSKMSF